MDAKPLLVIPAASNVAAMLDRDVLVSTSRAQRIGVVVIPPRHMRPADVMAAAHLWPSTLRPAGVSRLAVILGVEAYVNARAIVPGCQHKLHEAGIAAAYFHEGHLESDQIRAFFEARKPRRRVTTDALIKLSQRYALRGDIRSATHARRLAESVASV
jgi:hypothetical protein